MFKTVDRDLDFSTGLVTTSRDSAGVATGFEYDKLRRPTWVMPATGANDGWTEYAYTRATSAAALAAVAIRQRANGSKTAALLAQQEVKYDALGRPWQMRQLMANGTWPTRETLYNAAGLKASVSELSNTAKTTQFLSYDPFGRPGTIRPPDGSAHDVTLTYFGVRITDRKVKVGTISNGITGAVNETQATTTERLDGQGRLYQVLEPSGDAGATVTTTYTYDVANRLYRASTTASVGAGTYSQNRYFGFDGRGFLNWEKHPEKGPATCNASGGHVCYSGYDALGHPGQKIDGPNNLSFFYDRAERLTLAKETGVAGRTLKTFSYATFNSGANLRNGKLEVASCYNYVGILFNATVQVSETYAYAGC